MRRYARASASSGEFSDAALVEKFLELGAAAVPLCAIPELRANVWSNVADRICRPHKRLAIFAPLVQLVEYHFSVHPFIRFSRVMGVPSSFMRATGSAPAARPLPPRTAPGSS
jgi:hypothetical protein